MIPAFERQKQASWRYTGETLLKPRAHWGTKAALPVKDLKETRAYSFRLSSDLQKLAMVMCTPPTHTHTHTKLFKQD